MEQRLANCSRMTINEKKFIENALFSELRVDGRRPFDSRSLTIKFGREDGSAEVQLGQTHVMSFVTSELVQPYRDRPNEGTLSIYTEFSPMADPSFEPGRPGEFAVELGRVIDRGLRESRAVDTESLCILSGKLVWALRVDLHILDNGGNLVDAANIGALAALSTFRRPDCDLGGEDGQAVIVHPPEVKEPLPLIIHHLPVAVTFAIFDNGNILVIDPTHKEEVVSGGKITVTMNANGDVCAIQKAGGEGVLQSTMMQCLRIAAVQAADVTSIIKSSVEAYNTERALRKVKRHPTSVAVDVVEPDVKMGKPNGHPGIKEDAGGDKMDVEMGESSNVEIKKVQAETNILEQRLRQKPSGSAKTFIGGPSSWDPYSKGIDSSSLREPPTSTGPIMLDRGQEKEISLLTTDDPMLDEPSINKHVSSLATVHQSGSLPETGFPRTLKDAVKQKNRKKKNR